ncbi:MAG: hypothetical protein GY821_04255, partial [Gammaproteobacteria bacterium]|nr:hypothetical protein [Gammaproteobacteria bacterium]
QEACPENMPENGYYNDHDPDQCEIGGQYQYGPNDSADENYFENNERQHIGGYVEYPNDVNNSQQGSAEYSCGANQGENVPIYSQVPFQPEPSRLEDIFQHLSSQMANVDQKVSGMDQKMSGIDQKVSGVDQRVAKIEQKRSQSQTPNFRLSYAEGNIPMQSEKKLYSSPNQSLAKGVQGVHSAVSDLVENKQQNQHQSRKMRQDFCEDASHSNRPHKSSLASENPAPPSSQPGFRLSYEGGNRPTNQQDENCQKCASIQDQHPNEGKILAQSSDCCENGEQNSHCRQPQSIQMKSGLV